MVLSMFYIQHFGSGTVDLHTTIKTVEMEVEEMDISTLSQLLDLKSNVKDHCVYHEGEVEEYIESTDDEHSESDSNSDSEGPSTKRRKCAATFLTFTYRKCIARNGDAFTIVAKGSSTVGTDPKIESLCLTFP